MIAGIDPSLTGLAICISECVSDCDVHMRRFTSEASKDGMAGRFKRYRQLVRSTNNFLHQHDLELILLEGYSYASKGKAILDIAEFGGLLRKSLLYDAVNDGIRILEIPPSALKKFITGKGNVSKMEMCVAIAKRYDVEYATNDEYDAYALAQMGAAILGKTRITKAQAAVVAPYLK